MPNAGGNVDAVTCIIKSFRVPLQRKNLTITEVSKRIYFRKFRNGHFMNRVIPLVQDSVLKFRASTTVKICLLISDGAR